jgi:hypothetical protein
MRTEKKRKEEEKEIMDLQKKKLNEIEKKNKNRKTKNKFEIQTLIHSEARVVVVAIVGAVVGSHCTSDPEAGSLNVVVSEVGRYTSDLFGRRRR